MDSGLGVILTGIATSFSASILFLLFLVYCRPRILVVPKISKINENGQDQYVFKFINQSSWFDIVDVECESFYKTETKDSSGTIARLVPVQLMRDKMYSIPKFNKEDRSAQYATRVRVALGTNLESEPDTTHIIFRVKCRHWLSGYAKVFEQTYGKSDIMLGAHKFGNEI